MKDSERVSDMYQSSIYEDYAIYPSIDRQKVFAVIGMCLVLREHHFTNEEIIAFVNFAFRRPKKYFIIWKRSSMRCPAPIELRKNGT